jgi:hypothetical protein
MSTLPIIRLPSFITLDFHLYDVQNEYKREPLGTSSGLQLQTSSDPGKNMADKRINMEALMADGCRGMATGAKLVVVLGGR